jgi:hypothetical protein
MSQIEKHSSHGHRTSADRRRKKRIKHIISLILSFLLSLSGTAFLVLIGCKAGIFNSSIIMSQLNKTDYYAHIGDALYEDAADLIRPSGLPESVLEDVIDENKVYIDAKNSIDAAMSGKTYEADGSFLKENFSANIEAYIEENDIQANDETEAGLEELSEEIVGEYNDLLEFPFAKYYIKYQAVYDRIFWPAVISLAVFMIIICIVLVAMQHWAHRGVRYISYAALASALMTGGVPLAVRLSGIYERLNISPSYLYHLLMGVIEADIDIFLYLAAAALLAFAVCLGVIRMLKNRAMAD